MQHPGFFERAAPMRLADLARVLELHPGEGTAGGRLIHDVRPLADAAPEHITFLDNKKYLAQLADTKAGACLISPAFAGRVPTSCVPLPTPQPYVGFALALRAFYPEAMHSKVTTTDITADAGPVHSTAQVEAGARVETGAIIGREARIGRGSVVTAGAVIGYRCHVGRECYIGPTATLTHTLIGDRVIVHAGVRLGQDGFGFAMGPRGHLKVPQIGRVIIQDDVEIGAGTCIDRGALSDTIIGEGTKIDNLVQIGHNVNIGRHCVIVGQVGIAGSAVLGDFVVIGGQAGVAGHLHVGAGAQIAGASHVKDDVPAGARYGGTPARPLRQWAREIFALQRLAAGDGDAKQGQ